MVAERVWKLGEERGKRRGCPGTISVRIPLVDGSEEAFGSELDMGIGAKSVAGGGGEVVGGSDGGRVVRVPRMLTWIVNELI